MYCIKKWANEVRKLFIVTNYFLKKHSPPFHQALQKSVMASTSSPTLAESASSLASSSSSSSSLSVSSDGLRTSAGITTVPAKSQQREVGWHWYGSQLDFSLWWKLLTCGFLHSPNCRGLYGFDEIPTQYYCYCGKQPEPEPNPWNTPHTYLALGLCLRICSLTPLK